MKKIILFFLSLLMLTIFSFCKNDNCSDGYKSFEDTCICPDGKFEGFGECRNLEENEFYGINNCSAFTDTVFLQFVEKKDGIYTTKLYTSKNSYTELSFSYIEYINYDSIFVQGEYWTSGFYGHRFIDGEGTCSAQVFGRLTTDSFNGRIDWRNINTGDLVESCPFTLGR